MGVVLQTVVDLVRCSRNLNGCHDCLWKLLQFVSIGQRLPAVLATVGSVQSEASNLIVLDLKPTVKGLTLRSNR